MLLSRLRAWQTASSAVPQRPVRQSTVLDPAAPFSDLSRTLNLPVPRSDSSVLRCLSRCSLTSEDQRHLFQLERLVRLSMRYDADRTLVACRAVCSAASSSTQLEHLHTCHAGSGTSCGTSFTGVNFALHTLANSRGGGRRLKGLLKGCAEQNTLGTVAAHGVPYTSVSRLFLVSSEAFAVADDRVTGGGVTRDTSKGALYPCPECWEHLVAVAEMRQESGLSPLQFITCLPPSDASRLDVVQHFDQLLHGESQPPPITVTLLTS